MTSITLRVQRRVSLAPPLHLDSTLPMIDSWEDAPAAPTPGTSSTASPARASRLKGLSNDIPHSAFTRVSSSSSTSLPDRFSVGQAVIISAAAETRQEWLKTPDHVVRAAGGKLTRDRKGKGKARAVEELAASEWQVNDGLGVGEKVAIIVGLYEDARGEMLAKVRWFARPGAVWGHQGPEEGEEVQDFELYYTSDSTHLHETRALQSWTPSSSRTRPSTSVADRTPLHTDSVPISTIVSHAEILAPSEPFPTNAADARRQGAMPSYLVRKVYDAKPVAGAEFIGEIDYQDVYSRGMSHGDWDVEAIMDEEEEVVVSRATKKGKEKEKKSKKARPSASKSKVGAGKKGKNYAESENGSSDDDDDDEETFNPKSDVEESEDGSEGSASGSDNENDASSNASSTTSSKPLRTPTKNLKRKAPSQLTPSKSAKKSTAATPAKRVRPKLTAAAKSRAGNVEQKRSNYKKKRAERFEAVNSIPPTFTLSAAFKKLPPFKQAQALLHVSATPEFLPCREKQREEIVGILGDGIISGSGTCLYIHGVPGTGKTATVHSVVRELQNDPDIPPFHFVEINGMKIAEPATAFSVLWEAVSGGKKAAPRVALGNLEKWFGEPRVGRGTTVVLVDELDQMITKKQDVVYNFFNWPHMPHSKLIVIAVANTMDLPERELSGKIRSRLGSNRLVFTPYKWDELSTIITSRLDQAGKGLKDKVFGTKAIEVIAKKVAAGAGDARRALDVARRTVDLVSQRNSSSTPPATSLCTIHDASSTYRTMTDYGSSAFLGGLSLMEKVLMLSLAQVVRRRGVQEVEVDEVLSHHLSFLTQTSLLTPPPTQTALLTLLSSLHAQKLLTTESQRGDTYQRVRLLIGVGEVFEALREDGVLGGWVPRGP